MVIKVLGTALLIAGGMGAGWCGASALDRRVRSLRAFCAALETAQRELSLRLPPMPELLSLLARQSEGPAGRFFARCLEDLPLLGSRSFARIWRDALEGTPLDLNGEDLEMLSQAGRVLGRYDGAGQEAALELIRLRLVRALEEAEERRRGGKRVWYALGITAGCFLAILLL